MAKAYTKVDTALYQAPYEVLAKRNKQILALGILGMFLFAGLGWLVYGLAAEAIAASIEMTESAEEGGHKLNGGIWYSLLAALLFSIASAPIASAFTIMTYRNKDVSDDWIRQVYGLLTGIPSAVIWGLLWLVCLPFTWGLLPWGEWSVNWWKIFPFGFGLIWLGGLPLIITVIKFFKKLANPEYNHDLTGGQMPTQPAAESTASTAARSVDTRPSYVEAEIGSEPSSGRGAIFAAILAIFMLIPGIILLIFGLVMAEGFIEGEGNSSYTLEIIDEDGLGDRGFIIFIQGTPGDFNGNGVHDYCENVIVNANHSGALAPSAGWYNGVDETRQVFELEITQKGSGCDAIHWPKEKWQDDTQLVKIGRACYGCLAGTTTITAEYANEPTKPAGMWIQDGEKIHESTVLTIIGGIFSGIGVLTLVGLAIIKITKSKAAAQAVHDVEKDLIEIIESHPGQPVRFKLNDPPKGRDAWVGIYPASTGDQEHGGRWRWLRDIDVNNATLPGQSAGKWSIRVFKDGGYKLQHRIDFEIQSLDQKSATPAPSKAIVEGMVVLKSVHGKYLSAQPDGRAEWNRDRADAWEYFHLENRKGGKITLKGAHGKYVSAQPDGSVQINREAAPLGGWEEFTVETHIIQPTGSSGYEVVRLKSIHGKYLSAQLDGRVEWNRDHAPDGGWEDIDMEYVERQHQGHHCEINILEARAGKPIRFNVNNRPNGNEAWFGLYPVQATDHEHGEQHKNWMYFRDVGQNELSLPAKSAGRWSIRVFSDGGFNMIKRLDFDIVEIDEKSAQSAKKIQSVLRKTKDKADTGFWSKALDKE